MPFNDSIKQREHEKFRNIDGDTAVAVSLVGAIPSDYDEGTVTFPSATSTAYSFYKDAVLLRTVTLNYSDSQKETLIGWVIT
jgi:hypothetical protein